MGCSGIDGTDVEDGLIRYVLREDVLNKDVFIQDVLHEDVIARHCDISN